MGDAKPGVMDATSQIFVLAFDLVDSEFERLPQQAVAALTSPSVEAAIKKTLLDYAKSKAQAGGTTVVSGDEAKKLLTAIGEGGSKGFEDEPLKKIKATSEFKKLSEGIENFQKAAKSSALGVWVDRNKGVLYVVGAGLVVGTATALYVTRTGGSPVSTAVSQIAGKEFEILQIGQLKLKAGLWDFKPDARILGARVAANADWKRVKLDLKLGVMAEGDTLKQVEGEAIVKSGPITVKLTGDVKPQPDTVNLALNIGYKKDQFNFGLGAVYKDALLSGQGNAGYNFKGGSVGVTGNVGQTKEGRVQYGALATLTVTF